MPVDGVVSDTSIEKLDWPSEGAYLQVILLDEGGLTQFNELEALHSGSAASCPQQLPEAD